MAHDYGAYTLVIQWLLVTSRPCVRHISFFSISYFCPLAQWSGVWNWNSPFGTRMSTCTVGCNSHRWYAVPELPQCGSIMTL
eukprot:jgi/Chrzof1/15252/UNPLg00646.t1